MKVVALISFFDERPDWLAACVAALSKCCDHVVAVDGAYSLFPQAKAHSGDVQASAIVSTAQSLDLGVTYFAPQTVWMENEVEKRNLLLTLGKAVAGEKDWLLVIDADTLVREVPFDFRQKLEQTDADVGSYWITEDGEGRYTARYLYRALPDLEIRLTHYGYWVGDRYLWEPFGEPTVTTDLVVEHRRKFRNPDRIERSEAYYRVRNEYGIETRNPLELAS